MPRLQILLPLSVLLFAGQVPTVGAIEAGSTTRLETYETVEAPPAFREACERYEWLCGNEPNAADGMSDGQMLALAERVNARVNRAVEQVSDLENHGKVDDWTLPQNGQGDCEDFALEKMRELLRAGIAPRRLLMAVALYRKGENHAVLILRLDSGDLVLDSLTGRIRSPDQTGYRFLAMQSSEDRAQLRVALRNPSAEKRGASVSSMTATDPKPWTTPKQR